MSECEEIAAGMVQDYPAWLVEKHLVDAIDVARIFVRTRMPMEGSSTIIDNTAWALRAMIQPRPPEPEPYPDQGSW